jgi:hypothetical protein
VGSLSSGGIAGGGNLLAVKKWDGSFAGLWRHSGRASPVATGGLNNQKIIYEFGCAFA